MSSDCIYKESVVRITPDLSGQKTDKFMVIGLYGSSNTYDFNNRRSRSWSINSIGSSASVIANAISAASGFDGGMLYFRNFGASGSLTGIEWIKKTRRMLSAAVTLETLDGVHLNSDYIKFNFIGSENIEQQFRSMFAEANVQEDLKSRYNGYHFLRVSGSTY